MDFNKTIGPGKNNRLINIGPMFVLFQEKEQGRKSKYNGNFTLQIYSRFSEKQENKKHKIRPDIKWTEIHQCALLRSGGYRRVSEIMAAPANRVDRYVDVESM